MVVAHSIERYVKWRHLRWRAARKYNMFISVYGFPHLVRNYIVRVRDKMPTTRSICGCCD